MEILGLIVAGAIIGALARFFMKGHQPMGILATIALGIVGTVAGWYIAGALGVAHTNGIDWIRWAISIVVSMAAIAIYLAVTNRPRNTTQV